MINSAKITTPPGHLSPCSYWTGSVFARETPASTSADRPSFLRDWTAGLKAWGAESNANSRGDLRTGGIDHTRRRAFFPALPRTFLRDLRAPARGFRSREAA